MSTSSSAGLCRVCANPFTPGTMFRLFNERNDPLPIAEAFWRVSEIELRVDDDGEGSRMPQNCCLRCRDRLQEVVDLRAVCLESDRKLRKMLGVGMKEEEEEEADGEMGHLEAIPKVELLEEPEAYSCWDDMEDRWGSDDSDGDSEDIPLTNQSRRSSGRVKSERNAFNDKMDSSKTENKTTKGSEEEEDTDHEKDSDYDPEAVELKPKRKGRKKTKPKVKRKPVTSEDGTDPPKPKEKKPKQPKTFQCTWCGRIFKHKKSLLEHETSHFPDQKNYKCEICSAEFARHKYYLRHMRMHRTENQFKCTECDRAFSFEKQLQQHISIVHRGERAFQCNLCAKTFTRGSSLHQHVAYHHEKRQPYKCDVCMLRFITKCSLEKHKNRHKGIKLHQCPHCPNKYESKNYLLQHVAERHPETMENLSRCQYCGLGYNTDSHYRKHVAKKHPEYLEELDRWLKAKRERVPQPPPPPSEVVANEWSSMDIVNNVESSCSIENSAMESFPTNLATI